ncbi:hypothetical protein [Martelella limonii]|uniref:hypothetical protein n=1 Tax=Martelella limonii TaxID=1647649 RepID=UPI00157FD478|nr:hypothetical protein [Martelella limonii]
MSDVIKFPARDRIEIHFCLVTGATVTDANGTHRVFYHVGERRFFVDLIDSDGIRLGMHDCESYDEAIIAAGDLAREWGCEVYDRVVRDEGGDE